MSYQSSAYFHGPNTGHHVDRSRHPAKGHAKAHPKSDHRNADYTLTHAGRQVRLGPIAWPRRRSRT